LGGEDKKEKIKKVKNSTNARKSLKSFAKFEMVLREKNQVSLAGGSQKGFKTSRKLSFACSRKSGKPKTKREKPVKGRLGTFGSIPLSSPWGKEKPDKMT